MRCIQHLKALLTFWFSLFRSFKSWPRVIGVPWATEDVARRWPKNLGATGGGGGGGIHFEMGGGPRRSHLESPLTILTLKMVGHDPNLYFGY